MYVIITLYTLNLHVIYQLYLHKAGGKVSTFKHQSHYQFLKKKKKE